MKNPLLLVALTLAFVFTACSEDNSGSYILITDLELPEAQATTSSDDSGDLDSSESASATSSDSDNSSSSSEGSNAASSSSEASSSEREADDEVSSSSTDTLNIVVPTCGVLKSDSTTIPAGETAYATVSENADKVCLMNCFTTAEGETLTVDGEEYTSEANTCYQLEEEIDCQEAGLPPAGFAVYLASPCAGATYLMSATADTYCLVTGSDCSSE